MLPYDVPYGVFCSSWELWTICMFGIISANERKSSIPLSASFDGFLGGLCLCDQNEEKKTTEVLVASKSQTRCVDVGVCSAAATGGMFF